MEKELITISELTIPAFRRIVGGKVFTVEFYKLPKTAEEVRVGRGEYRKMNARLGVKAYVKGTQPQATARRNATNAEQLQIGCYEMRGTSDRIEAENYRTLALSDDRFISLTVGGKKYVNRLMADEPITIGKVELGEDRVMSEDTEILIGAGEMPESTIADFDAMLEGANFHD